jgi:hypothetical protein
MTRKYRLFRLNASMEEAEKRNIRIAQEICRMASTLRDLSPQPVVAGSSLLSELRRAKACEARGVAWSQTKMSTG